ncbi:MAG: hypothetical protein ACYCXQ_00970 [Candidatus Humimicrobiaceae bacterium]
MVDATYQPKIYKKNNGDSLVVANGGDIDIESGGALKIGGTALTTTAAEINKLAGAGTKVASGTVHAHVADPSGGATNDAEARTAINAILAALEAFGINASS